MSTNVIVTLQLDLYRVARGDKIFEDDINDVLVKDLNVAERVDVEFEAFQLDAELVWDVFQPDHTKIGEIREWADGRKLRHIKFDPDLAARKFVWKCVERKETHLLTRCRADV